MTRSCTTVVPVTPGPSMSVSMRGTVEALGRDVEDLLDHEADAAAVLGVDDDLQRLVELAACGTAGQHDAEPGDRQDAAAVLQRLAVPDLLELDQRDLLEPGHGSIGIASRRPSPTRTTSNERPSCASSMVVGARA